MKKRLRRLVRRGPLWPLAAVAALVIGSGAALAGHVTPVDPATVPTGFLAAHNSIADLEIRSIARAAAADGADVFVQHVRLDPNTATAWHTHPGPAIVTIVKGGLLYQDGNARHCRQIPYNAGGGFVDRGFGHVHRAVAGAEGVDFYVTYILPPGSATHVIPTDPPAGCVSSS
jgi:hypothetical protein